MRIQVDVEVRGERYNYDTVGRANLTIDVNADQPLGGLITEKTIVALIGKARDEHLQKMNADDEQD